VIEGRGRDAVAVSFDHLGEDVQDWGGIVGGEIVECGVFKGTEQARAYILEGKHLHGWNPEQSQYLNSVLYVPPP